MAIHPLGWQPLRGRLIMKIPLHQARINNESLLILMYYFDKKNYSIDFALTLEYDRAIVVVDGCGCILRNLKALADIGEPTWGLPTAVIVTILVPKLSWVIYVGKINQLEQLLLWQNVLQCYYTLTNGEWQFIWATGTLLLPHITNILRRIPKQ